MTERNSLSVTKIYEQLRKDVEKSILKLEKKAKRLGVPTPQVTLGDSYVHTYEEGVLGNIDIYAIDVFDISIKFDDIKFNGWTPIAFLDTIDKVYIQLDIEADYDYDFELALEDRLCEHCNTRRNRRKVWVLQNDDGSFIKVGSTCIKDFTGISPDSFFKMFQFVQKMVEDFCDEEWTTNGGNPVMRNPENYKVYEIDEIFTITKNIVEIDGCYIKSQWEDIQVGEGWGSYWKQVRTNEGEATADKVKDVLTRQNKRVEFDVEGKYFITKSSVDTDLVKGIREYLNQIVVRTTTEIRHIELRDENGEMIWDENDQGQYVEKEFIIENEFDARLKSFGEKKRTRRFDIGFICYIVEAYNIYLERLATPESKHIGTVGEKTVVEVTITKVSGFQTDFGWSNLYKMIDADGNVFTKFGKIGDRFITNDTDGIEVGSELKMNAVIKSHNDFKGNKETVIGRVSNPPKTKKVKA